MCKWEKVKLGDVCEKIGSGATPKGGKNAYKPSGISLIRSQNVLDFSFSVDGLAFIDHEQASKLDNVALKEHDVLINITGDSVARVCIVPTKFLPARVNQHVAILRCNDIKINYHYLQYLLIHQKDKLLSLASVGATRNALTKGMLENLEIPLPPLKEQKRIAAILSSLDDKIEVNNQINKNLEEQAQAIFKSWFVDFEPFGGVMPSDWKKGTLGEYVTIKRGGSPRPIQEYLVDNGLRWLKISDVTSLTTPFVFNIKEHIKEEGLKKTVFLNADALVLSNSATPGIPKILAVDSCIHDGWLYFPESQLSNEFLYLVFKEIRKNLVQLGNGSVFTNLKTEILKNYSFSRPSNAVLEKFDNITQPIFKSIKVYEGETQHLIQMRNTLLQKFINDKIIS